MILKMLKRLLSWDEATLPLPLPPPPPPPPGYEIGIDLAVEEVEEEERKIIRDRIKKITVCLNSEVNNYSVGDKFIGIFKNNNAINLCITKIIQCDDKYCFKIFVRNDSDEYFLYKSICCTSYEIEYENPESILLDDNDIPLKKEVHTNPIKDTTKGCH